jgi:outer membrane protein assembly factor BamB
MTLLFYCLAVWCAAAIVGSSSTLSQTPPIWNVSFTTQTVAYFPTSTPLLLWGSRIIVGGGASDGTSALLGFRFDSTWLTPPQLQWTYAIPNTSAPTFSTPVPSSKGDRVYVGGNDNCVHAVDATSGMRLWKLCPSSSSSNQAMMVSCTRWENDVSGGDSLLCGSTDGNLYALESADTSKPAVSWISSQGGKVYANAVVAKVENESLVYIGSTGGTMTALAASTGAVRWAVATGAELDATPVVVVNFQPDEKSELCFGSDSGVFSCLDAASGSLVWSVSLNSSIKTRPVVADCSTDEDGSHRRLRRGFILGTMSGSLFCVSSPDASASSSSSRKISSDSTGLVVDESEKPLSAEAAFASGGRIVWSVPAAAGPVFTSPANVFLSSSPPPSAGKSSDGGSRIAVSTFSGEVLVVDANDGTVVWRGATPTGQAIATRFGSVACTNNGLSEECVLLVTSWDKNLYAFAL